MRSPRKWYKNHLFDPEWGYYRPYEKVLYDDDTT